jgi:hypothetical protein
VADIVAADARCRVAGVTVAEARDLVERARREAPAHPLLRWWATAMLAERALLDTDLAVVPVAAAALAEMSGDVFAPPVVLFVRGRLRRVASALYLALPSAGNRAAHRAARDAAMGDFSRGGFFAEVALTRALCASFVALAAWEDLPECLVAVRDAGACLAGPPDGEQAAEGAAWLPLVDDLRMLVALNAGDLDEVEAASAAMDRASAAIGAAGSPRPVLHAAASVGRAAAALVRSGGDDRSVAGMAAVFDRLRRDHPPFLALSQMHAANLLLDLGRAGPARRFALAALDWPPASPLVAALHELLRHRLALVDPASRWPPGTGSDPGSAGSAGGAGSSGGRRVAPAAQAAVDAVLDRFDAIGYRRAAGTWALRLAPDFDRAGAPEAAAALRRRGEAVVPGGLRRTPAERRWATPPGAGAVVAVRLLAPVVEVEVDGRPLPLRDMAAKLLLALLVAHPEPLHVEQAADVLWPDASCAVARRRLNTVVHRLRAALDAGAQVVRRRGDVLLIEPSAWHVDLFEFRRDVRATDPGARRRALGRVRGLLAHVQFPYDDLLIEARAAVAAPAARALADLHDDDAFEGLQAVLRAHGQPCGA